MAKTVSLNEFTYSKLAALSGELTIIVKKPVSLGMTVHLALMILEHDYQNPEMRKWIEASLQTALPPEEFDKQWENLFKKITKSRS
jgi:hypothetical protein